MNNSGGGEGYLHCQTTKVSKFPQTIEVFDSPFPTSKLISVPDSIVNFKIISHTHIPPPFGEVGEHWILDMAYTIEKPWTNFQEGEILL